MIFTGVRHHGGIHSKPIPWDKAETIYRMLMVDPEKNYRRLFAYSFGLYTGARASEIASITWENLFGINETARGRTDLRIAFVSKKGSDKRYPHLAPELIDAILKVKEWAEPFVVKSARPIIIHPKSLKKEATNRDASDLVNSALIIGGVFDTTGAHTLRKTLGRRMYDLHGRTDEAIHLIQKFLGHRSPQSTMSYIGITDEKIKHTIQNLGTQGILVEPESFFDILRESAGKQKRLDSDQGGDEVGYVLSVS